MKRIRIGLFLCLLIISGISRAQTSTNDTIVMVNGEVLVCGIREISENEIKYVLPEHRSDLFFVIDTDKVEKIIFADGKVQLFEKKWQEQESIAENSMHLFEIQRRNALKLDFLSLIGKTMALTYERSLSPGRSLEFSIGAVGIGFAENDDKASGILFRGGYKLARNPDFFLRGMRYAHILKGPYLKMELDLASYRVEGYKEWMDWNSEKEMYTINKWAILVVLGNQWVFSDSFVVDLYSGIGVGKNNLNDLDSTYPYGFMTTGDEFPLAMSFGLRLGFLIK